MFISLVEDYFSFNIAFLVSTRRLIVLQSMWQAGISHRIKWTLPSSPENEKWTFHGEPRVWVWGRHPLPTKRVKRWTSRGELLGIGWPPHCWKGQSDFLLESLTDWVWGCEMPLPHPKMKKWTSYWSLGCPGHLPRPFRRKIIVWCVETTLCIAKTVILGFKVLLNWPFAIEILFTLGSRMNI